MQQTSMQKQKIYRCAACNGKGYIVKESRKVACIHCRGTGKSNSGRITTK